MLSEASLREDAQRRASLRRDSRQLERPPSFYYYAPTNTVASHDSIPGEGEVPSRARRSGSISSIGSVNTVVPPTRNRGVSPQRLFSPLASPAARAPPAEEERETWRERENEDDTLYDVSLREPRTVTTSPLSSSAPQRERERESAAPGAASRRGSYSTGYSKSPGRFRMLDVEDELQFQALSVSVSATPTALTPRLLSPHSASRNNAFSLTPPSSSITGTVSAARSTAENATIRAARLAAKDYQHNGDRARRKDGEFVPPRWVPDEEVSRCTLCTRSFDEVDDWLSLALSPARLSTRRHHCRYCGTVVCAPCSPWRLLLPREYGVNEPQRVCNVCAEVLRPLQRVLSATIANHMQSNVIDVASDHCNVRRYLNAPYTSSLNEDIRKAAYSLHNVLHAQYVRDKAIPLHLISQAKGLAFITIVKGGFIFAPSIGTGLVVARLPPEQGGGWSAPCAISTWGLSWGALVGLEVTDCVLLLNTQQAVDAFCSTAGQLAVGAGLAVAVGPLGRSGSADVHISDSTIAPAYSYSQSRGFFAGLSLDGAVIFTRNEVNFQFYATTVTAEDLLHGRFAPPRAAEVLYSALQEVLGAAPNVHHALQQTQTQAQHIPTTTAPPGPAEFLLSLDASTKSGFHSASAKQQPLVNADAALRGCWCGSAEEATHVAPVAYTPFVSETAHGLPFNGYQGYGLYERPVFPSPPPLPPQTDVTGAAPELPITAGRVTPSHIAPPLPPSLAQRRNSSSTTGNDVEIYY